MVAVKLLPNEFILQLKVSYLEIHLDEVRDLLSNTAEEIHIREDDRGNTVVQGNSFQPLNLDFFASLP